LSRNFDLLKQLDRTKEILDSHQEKPETVRPTETAPSAPSVEMDGRVRDEIGKLVQNLFRSPNMKGPRRIVFTGTESGNGCSWMCSRVGEILASQVHESVCVVDCNLRSPGLHQQFAIENHYGLSDALLRSDPIRQYARPLSRPNLWILSCGSAAENGQTQLASEPMRLRLAELRTQFDYVLLDVAALNTCNDGIVLGSLSDGIVLVLKANSSRRDTARQALQQLQDANIPIFGAVLNQRTFPIPEALYKRL
jgi:succinoglycan biosynthesis transport protein ExoP